ncbi:odorant receptor 131-2-like isoform X2 [Fundulus heteroclitus]|uniref:odorant receptor 131-2-like isoform X2 n=1 Tax=Fundulus heteroclitus TaxID=8078 RepID=UPI00165BED19|nr:odorant receptor 131-2-like isoform X2 [Fundulus heteroclitus]
MNVSAANVTVVLDYRDSFLKAVIKNIIVVVLSISINYINAGIIHTFSKQQIFYTNPRYILYKIQVFVCCILMLVALFTTENTPLNLACMAMECYIAICIPLRHPQICTIKRTRLLILLIWTTSLLSVLPDLFITLATEPLDYFNMQVFCLRETAFRNPRIIERRNITYIVYLVLVWCVILYIYFRIIFTARIANKDAKKARNTILLHGFQLLLCMAGYAEHLLKQAVLQWFPKYYSDSLFACYIIFQILPRSISSIIYGIRDKTFRKHLKGHLLCQLRSH